MDKYRKLLMHLNYRAVDFSKSLFLEVRFHPGILVPMFAFIPLMHCSLNCISL